MCQERQTLDYLGAPWMVNILSECCSPSLVMISYSSLHTWKEPQRFCWTVLLNISDMLKAENSPVRSRDETWPPESSHSWRCWCKNQLGCRGETNSCFSVNISKVLNHRLEDLQMFRITNWKILKGSESQTGRSPNVQNNTGRSPRFWIIDWKIAKFLNHRLEYLQMS